MKIFNFVAGLLPNFERNRIRTELTVLREEYNTVIKPMFRNAGEACSNGFRAPENRAWAERFKREVPNRRSDGILLGVANIVDSVEVKLAAMEGMIDDLFAKDVAKEELTYRKANFLQILSEGYNVVTYAPALLLQILNNESRAIGMKVGNATPAEKRYVEQNFSIFTNSLVTLDNLPKDIRKAIMEIPDVHVEQDSSAVSGLVGHRSIDPFRMGLTNSRLNPVFTLRMNYAEWQAKRYHRRVAEKNALELKIIAMRQRAAGNSDPKITGVIEYNEARLQRMRMELQELEERYA